MKIKTLGKRVWSKGKLAAVSIAAFAVTAAYADGYFTYCASSNDGPMGSCPVGNTGGACVITTNPNGGGCSFAVSYCINNAGGGGLVGTTSQAGTCVTIAAGTYCSLFNPPVAGVAGNAVPACF